MGVTKPFRFQGFGAMGITKAYNSIAFWAMDITKPCRFLGLGLGLLKTRGLVAKCCAVPVCGLKRARKGHPRRRRRPRKKPETGPRSGHKETWRRSRRQVSEVIFSGSVGCSRRGSAPPTLPSPNLRCDLLRLGSCLALGRRPFLAKRELALERCAHFQK